MNTMKLNQFEIMAMEHAAKETVEDVLDAIFQQLWGAGIKSLEDMNGANYKTVLSSVAGSDDYKTAVQKILLTYSNQIRKDVQTQAIPF